MRIIVAIAVVSSLMFAWRASAQTPQNEAPQKHVPSAIELQNPELGSKTKEPASMVPGANSFAEGQAKALIESKGYDNVSALVNDSKGIWHGTATKGQAKVHVSVDYKGNVDVQ